ncbi:MarR family transcriptional regulator [Dankookia rubra]|uniref:MarR family transcriptional regulator n=1 Tax=Dankookia rubra TaxID=1442381 RepID=A0A4R5QBK8_9PROT|nr:MarR family transcriptional regulator [Dankookia rubra]TDH59969.1 MarR family transcriptional regulator [Dankookia rubra]
MTESPAACPGVAATPLDLDEFLCFAVHSTAQAIGRANKPMLDAIGLTYPQFLVMVVLWAEDDQTVGRIGDRLYLESNTLTPLLKRLEAAGYVTRLRCPEDERQVRIRLTEQGRALRAKAAAHRPEWVDRAFADRAAMCELRARITDLRERLLPKA